ncbi:endonuclease MutS2 [Thermovenabulum gondwanense]|uniref:Endonuclease MutS2 n=1 Tax=Thermovenabulum gondwanense TaxID=520767 RepID=A0A162MC25_9FIRM|nr:endonuclease MutS2 [Thermovenabulum gondwanense]KYO65221.1 Endonuclease MutS2 [Thermovenabulum gondwanense]
MNNKVLAKLEFDKIKNILKEYAVSDITRERIDKLEPQKDLPLIRRLQKETSEGVALLKRGFRLPFEYIPDISSSLKRAKFGAVLSNRELLDVAQIMKTSRVIKKNWEEWKIEGYEILQNLVTSLHNFYSLEEKIFKAILNEEEIADNASPALASLRKEKKVLFSRIREKLESIISSPSFQKFLQEPIVTIRQGRYVIPVKQEFRTSVPGIIHDQSSSGATLYIEPLSVLELNNELRKIEIEEKKEEERILKELTKKIADNYDSIKNSYEVILELDFILAKANYSIEINGIEPMFNEKGYLNIKRGRHPLLILKGEVVPIDLFLGDKFHVLVITGPNTGGKTVTLKTVGLFSIMAQSGLHLPAEEGTEVAVFNEVFADIGDEQSIEQSLSTFSSHMKNIVEIIENADEKSLVLLDELGAGTDPAEGAALAMAILNYFYERGIRTIATTHYSELKTFAFSRDGMENASVEFDVETLSPTYKLTIGIPGKSNAFEIAKRLGLKHELLETAKEFLKKENLELEGLLKSLEGERKKFNEELKRLNELKENYYKKITYLEEAQKKLAEKEDKIIEKAREKAKSILEKAKEEAEDIIEELKKVEDLDDRQNKDRIIELARKRLRENLGELKDEKPLIKKSKKLLKDVNFKPGDRVFVEGLNQEGFIVEINEKEKEALVSIGIMKINLPLNTLSKIEEASTGVKDSISYSTISIEKAKNIESKIDLRGLTLDEAILKVEKYLDDARVAGLPSIMIIHGKGTGILRKGIQDLLKKRKDVKTFRPGNYNEGGIGVTVVEFN